MNRGDRVFVETPGGRTLPGRYEFRVTEGEPLGHHSVYLDDNRGRVVVCGCRLQLPDEADQPAATETGPVPQYSHGADGSVVMLNHEEVVRASLAKAETALQCAPEPLDENWLATRRPAGGKGAKP